MPDQCRPPSVDLFTPMKMAERELPMALIAKTAPSGPKASHGSAAATNGPPEQVVNGSGTCCQDLPPSKDVADTTPPAGPRIQSTTILLGCAGLTAMAGSAASLGPHVPGNARPAQPLSVGRDSSVSGPRWKTCAMEGNATQASAMPARPTASFLSAAAARHATNLLASSSSLFFIVSCLCWIRRHQMGVLVQTQAH